MKYVKEQFIYTYEEKKSKFIAYLFPYSDFNENMKKIKEKYPKARHYVYAYRYLNDFDQIVENSSDDGEPKGTSGRPSLSVVAGNELINCSIIIVRFFGGIKLGTGGLVRAYSEACNLVINQATLYTYEKLIKKKLHTPYNDLSKVEYLCNTYKINILKKEFLNEVCLELEASREVFDLFKMKLQRHVSLE